MELWLVLIINFLAIAFAIFLAQSVLKHSNRTAERQNISAVIKEGAEAFLAQRNKTIAGLSVALANLLFVLKWLVLYDFNTVIYS